MYLDVVDRRENVLDFVHGWARACDGEHEACAARQGGPLPTRLISIGGRAIRLEPTEDWHSTPPYMTLSYCWGKLDFIQTRTSNLEEYLVEIPQDKLPKTFKDAIRIAQALGVGYLWIDSLCIIQDSAADWRKESCRMSGVYGNSYLNVAASSAIDPSQGCFLKPQYMRDALLADVTISGQQYAGEFSSPYSSYLAAVTDSHLMTRAWALQEKLLPTRTVHVGIRGALWECRSSIGIEGLPRLITDAVSHLGLGTLVSDLEEGVQFKKLDLWDRVVQAYSRANLTHGRDKLPALSGIAQRISKRMECEYLAGMWKDETFDAQLCWCSFGSSPRPKWRAPTWSWMSIDGYTTFRAYDQKFFEEKRMNSRLLPCARTLNASVTRVSESEFGEVSGGNVQLACSFILLGQIEQTPGGDEHGFFLSDGVRCGLLIVRLDCTDDIGAGEGDLAYVLPLTATSFEPEQSRILADFEEVRGLVLQRTGRAQGEFRRIGFFKCGSANVYRGQVRPSVDEIAAWDQFIELMHGHGAATAKEVCTEVIDDSKYGTGGCVITIV